jgi:serine/threonine protein kinase
MADLTGKTLSGKYHIVECIGQGRMATVYKAYQAALERYVAVKVFHEHLAAEDEQFLERFERGVKAVAFLQHPNILRVFDLSIEGDVAYMVMEYMEGTTLKARLNELALSRALMPLHEVGRIGGAVARALDYAHQKGIVHRDVKPANVMLTNQGGIMLTDLGIAAIVGAAGPMIGPPAYMSPEQGRGERGDERSDIYALGVMLYEMVTGRVLFEAGTPLAVIEKHISDPVPPPRQVNPAVPPAVERIVLKALAKNPDDRYQKAADMASELADAFKAFVEPRPPELLHVDFIVEGKVTALLDRGFSLDTGQGTTVIVSTLSRGGRLGLHPGDDVRVFGGPDPRTGVFCSSATLYKILPDGKEIEIKDDPTVALHHRRPARHRR